MNKPDSRLAASQEKREHTHAEMEHIGKPVALPEALVTLFARLDPAQVEQFTHSYQLWTLQQRQALVQQEIAWLQQQIADNASLTESVQPSPIALATLARLQASGVENLHLLDQMLDRGDTWLDHTAQLLERCEKLDLIRGDYTRWCENALEGAYDWLDSMNDEEASQDLQSSQVLQPVAQEENDLAIVPTAEELLQKLMSDDDSLEEPQHAHQESIAPAPEQAEMTETTTSPVASEETTTAPIQEQPTVESPIAEIRATRRTTQELPPLEGEVPIPIEDMQTLPHATAEHAIVPAEESLVNEPELELALDEIDTRPMTPEPGEGADQNEQVSTETPETHIPSPNEHAIEEQEVTGLDEEDTIELVPRRKPRESTSPEVASAEPGAEASPRKPQEDEVQGEEEVQGKVESPAPVAIEDEPTIPLQPGHLPNTGAEMQHNAPTALTNPSEPEGTRETRMVEEPGKQAIQKYTTDSENKKNLAPEKPQEEVTGTSEKGLPVLVRKVLGQIWNT
ncbi:hypothetical protein KSC_059350 [Ktedonobacter sp. SOSP1-52]|uniref:hypothetical protein n=1 Tax=Ktedonobacter sp. SOSP1-52 TaxID=2778366 RepID=UPI001916A1CE|nr:hypothetical protein [Ktedonobacter sp. SOSP1-52]GHO67043.1 hypothetical protein KSC_059350 [Ktedonobacter sp. SOSP1-52]